MVEEQFEQLRNYIDLTVASTAKQFGAISLDAAYILAAESLDKPVLTFEEVKKRTRAPTKLILRWIGEGRLRSVVYPDQTEPLFDKVDVDRLILQYVSSDNEKIIQQIIHSEKKARKKVNEHHLK